MRPAVSTRWSAWNDDHVFAGGIQTGPVDLQLQTECIPVAPVLTLHGALAATAGIVSARTGSGAAVWITGSWLRPPKWTHAISRARKPPSRGRRLDVKRYRFREPRRSACRLRRPCRA